MLTDTHTSPSYSIKNRTLRFLWKGAYWCCFRLTPRPMHRWRSWLLSIFGAKLGKDCHIYPDAVIWAPWNLVCEDEACIGEHVQVYNHAPIFIGKRAVISQGTNLCTGTHDYNDPNFPLIAKPIHIGAHAWIAAESFVHPGITIGEGCVVGARSVVTHDLPEWHVCVGHPCHPIKLRQRI